MNTLYGFEEDLKCMTNEEIEEAIGELESAAVFVCDPIADVLDNMRMICEDELEERKQ